jgi:peptidoglycan hydrolase-like protein with peptidoglycan-binding domain
MAKLRRTAVLVTSGVLVVGMGALWAPALADGPDTPDDVVEAIQDSDWPELVEGDTRWEVSVVKFLLVDYGFLDVNHADEHFDERLTEAVKDYQEARDLDADGTVGGLTWRALTADLGLVRQGDEDNRVKAVQTALIHGYGYDLLLDGEFGTATRGAVVEFQSVKCIDPDGIVGPITFQALITNPGDTCD